MILRTGKKVYEVIFKGIYSESLFNTLYIEKNTNAEKNSFGQNIHYNKCSLSSFECSNSSQIYFYVILIWAEESALSL